jgi:isoquinoline 1-oxidoreductase beta subunit
MMKRRTFFKISSVAGGGLLLGFNLTGCKEEAPLIARKILDLPSDWFDMNTFLKIGSNGVVSILSPNPEIGQNVKTSMPMIVAEELDVDWENVLVEQATLDTDAFKRQVAGGSQSIRQGWNSLREAGATARQMLVAAAAKQWEIKPEDCTTDKGFVISPDGSKLSYGEIAQSASELEAPEEITLKDPKDYKIIGTSRMNVDRYGIVEGKPLFGIDTKKEGMLHASVLRPPAFGQTLVSYDDAAAKAVNGVVDVIKFGDKIAVLANNSWQAMKGKQALTAEWKDEAPESTEDHDRLLGELLEANENEPFRSDGDVEKAFAEADEVVKRVYESPFLPHNCLEPMNFYADVREDEVILEGPIQTPAWCRSRVAAILERPMEQIKVSMTRMGGGFGRRLYGDFSDEAAEISSLAGKPVQLLFTREDDMSAGTYRPAIKYMIQASIKDNEITGYQLSEAAINNNMYGLIPNFFPAGAIDNYKVIGHSYASNITTGAWRAPYTNFLAYAEQSFFDELAEKMGKDPVALRMELLEKAIAPAADDDTIEYAPKRMQGVLQLVAEKSGYPTKKEGVYQGVSAYYSHNTHVAEIADVVLENGIPKVVKVTCAVDCGIVVNPIAARNQVQGGIIDGIGHAMYGNLTFEGGRPTANNFDKFRLIRNNEAPEIDVHFVENTIDPTGLGEPSLPPAGGAVANAIYRATGKRIYKQPFINEMEVVG